MSVPLLTYNDAETGNTLDVTPGAGVLELELRRGPGEASGGAVPYAVIAGAVFNAEQMHWLEIAVAVDNLEDFVLECAGDVVKVETFAVGRYAISALAAERVLRFGDPTKGIISFAGTSRVSLLATAVTAAAAIARAG